jgi:hypothetical protein
MRQKREKNMYLNSVTIAGFAGADPEQRQAKGNGTKFTVLSVATQRSWKEKRRRRMGLEDRVAPDRDYMESDVGSTRRYISGTERLSIPVSELERGVL